MKKNSRRKYDPDFKRNAVLLCIEQGRSVAEVADNLVLKGIFCTTGEANIIKQMDYLPFQVMVLKR